MYLLGNLPFFKIHVNCFMARDDSPCANAISKCMLWVRGLVPFWVLRHFLSLISSLLINFLLNTSKGALFQPPLCLCQKLSLSLLYFNKTLLHKSSEQSSLVSGPRLNSSPPEAKNPGIISWFSNNLSSWGLTRDPLGQGKNAWSSSSLFS